jgi:hypothetical protein
MGRRPGAEAPGGDQGVNTPGNFPRIIAPIPTKYRGERAVKTAHSIPYRKYNRAKGLRVPIPGDGG